MNGNDWFHIFKCSHEILASTQSPDCPFNLDVTQGLLWVFFQFQVSKKPGKEAEDLLGGDESGGLWDSISR